MQRVTVSPVRLPARLAVQRRLPAIAHLTPVRLASAAAAAAPEAEAAGGAGSSGGGSGSGSNEGSSTGRTVGLIFFGTMVTTTLGLGTWQALRYGWKVELLEARRAALSEPPLDLSEGWRDDDVDPAAMGTRRVSVSGTFDYAHEVRITPRPPPKDAPQALVPPTATGGYLAVTPLVRPDGTRVLVLRGWVPHSKEGSGGGGKAGGDVPVTAWGAADAAATGPAGVVTVTGVLREGEDPGSWAVKHYPERSEFTWLDLPSIAEHTGTLRRGPQTDRATVDAPLVRLPLLVEAIEPYPQTGGKGGPLRPLTKQLSAFAETYVMPHSHLIYSGTWYTLSLFGAVITYTRFLRGRGGAGGGGAAASAAARKAAAAAANGGSAGETLAAGTRRGRR